MRISIFLVIVFAVAPPAFSANLKSAKDCNIEWSNRKEELLRSTQRAFAKACWNSEVGTATPLEINSEPVKRPVEEPIAQPPSSPTDHFAKETDAQRACPTQLVVWLNTRSKMVHLPGQPYYGSTVEGAYMCASDALKNGGWKPNVTSQRAASPRRGRCRCRAS